MGILKNPPGPLTDIFDFDPENYDPDSPEFALPPEIEAQWPEISERMWQKVKACLDAEGWTQDPAAEDGDFPGPSGAVN